MGNEKWGMGNGHTEDNLGVHSLRLHIVDGCEVLFDLKLVHAVHVSMMGCEHQGPL